MKLYIKITLIALITTSPIFSMDPFKTPLHHAAAKCTEPIHSIFEQNKSAIMKKDGDGNIPLHEAAAFGCKKHVDYLLEHGLEHLWGNRWELGKGLSLVQLRQKINSLQYDNYINAQNSKGETPLDKAHYFKQPAIEKILKAYGGHYNIYKDLNVQPMQQELDNSLLYPYGLFQSIISLKRGANPNFKGSEGMTPLHHLALMAEYTTPYLEFEILLAYGANINALDNEGYTPYDRAITVAGGQTGDHITNFFKEHKARTQFE